MRSACCVYTQPGPPSMSVVRWRAGVDAGGNEAFVGEEQTPQRCCSFPVVHFVPEVVWFFPHILSPTGPAALPKGQSTAARASLTSLHMGKNIFQKKEIIKSVR